MLNRIFHKKNFLLIFVFFLTMHSLSYSNSLNTNKNKLLLWLCDIDLKKISNSPFKYVIIDYSQDGSKAKEFSRKDIENLRNSLSGKRIIFSYLSIGEAESYRFYWAPSWNPDKNPSSWNGFPKFLGPENKDWQGNFLVDYRSSEWKKIIFAYVDKIISQGFDGIYLDKVDSYINLQSSPYCINEAREQMEEFIIQISKHAKSKCKNFKIIVQNAEELAQKANTSLPNEKHLNAVDGIGKEEAFFYNNKKRSNEEIKETVRYLNLFKKYGKLVFTIDYPDLKNKKELNWIYNEAEKYGFMEYCGVLELNQIILQP